MWLPKDVPATAIPIASAATTLATTALSESMKSATNSVGSKRGTAGTGTVPRTRAAMSDADTTAAITRTEGRLVRMGATDDSILAGMRGVGTDVTTAIVMTIERNGVSRRGMIIVPNNNDGTVTIKAIKEDATRPLPVIEGILLRRMEDPTGRKSIAAVMMNHQLVIGEIGDAMILIQKKKATATVVITGSERRTSASATRNANIATTAMTMKKRHVTTGVRTARVIRKVDRNDQSTVTILIGAATTTRRAGNTQRIGSGYGVGAAQVDHARSELMHPCYL
jgi:hypothetical protein